MVESDGGRGEIVAVEISRPWWAVGHRAKFKVFSMWIGI